jgi:hypothetical protein
MVHAKSCCYPYCHVVIGLPTTQFKYVAVQRVTYIGHALNPLDLFYIREMHMGNNEYTNKQDKSRPFQVYA